MLFPSSLYLGKIRVTWNEFRVNIFVEINQYGREKA